mmetsp:Transcript_7736/g.10139  ORF Transcript_7736/g.10139 Transcript_7736/m.10139 type:complete len:236 (+) Transcript_7736:86-793(+)
MENSRQQIDSLHTSCIGLIKDGYLDQAYEGLLQGSSMLSSCVRGSPPVHLKSTAAINQRHSEIYVCSDESEEETDDGTTDFYPHPFDFEYADDLPSSPSRSQPDLTSSQYETSALVFLFNLGVCCHLAWEQDQSNLRYLVKASEFYQRAIAFLQNKDRTTFVPTGTVLKVLLAITINAAHCSATLLLRDRVALWESILHDLLRFASTDIFNSKDYRFMRGLLFQRPNQMITAKAA